jgi:aspartate carbamoyltransferase catalytic subunit
MKHLLATQDLTSEWILNLFEEADGFAEVAEKKGKCMDLLEGKILAALFYEPSTRTRLSTETAMLRLGGKVINSIGIENSSLLKGETLADTAEMVSRYADIIAIRHPAAGSAAEFAAVSKVPVINCGDGPNDHPTQALLDAYTIYKQYGRLDNLKVALVGDLKFSRTSHGLLALLNKFKGNQVVLCSPAELPLGSEYYYENIEYTVENDIAKAIQGAQVIYSSRVQKERFADLQQYEKLKDYFVFTLSLLETNATDAILLHALPRIDEIAVEVDSWKGAKYFEAVTNGVAIRMAILNQLLNN